MVSAGGPGRTHGYAKGITETARQEIGKIAPDVGRVMCRHITASSNRIGRYEARPKIEVRSNPQDRWRCAIPDLGPTTAWAIAAAGAGPNTTAGAGITWPTLRQIVPPPDLLPGQEVFEPATPTCNGRNEQAAPTERQDCRKSRWEDGS